MKFMEMFYQKPLSRGPAGWSRTVCCFDLLLVLFISALLATAQERVEEPQPTEMIPSNAVMETFVMTNDLEETNVFVPNAFPGNPAFEQTNLSVQIRTLAPTNLPALSNASNQPSALAATNVTTATNETSYSQEESATRKEFLERLRNSPASHPSSAASSSRTDYNAFQIIWDRNIFNQNRLRGDGQ